MEHACYKCAAAVEDGVPFCPQCRAPQIRVARSEATSAPPPLPPEAEAATPPPSPSTTGEMQPPAQPTPVPRAGFLLTPHAIEWSKAVPGAILGSILGVVLVALLSGLV